MNGFELAKELEAVTEYCLEPDGALVDLLDDIYSEFDKCYYIELTNWIKEYEIKPMLEVGDNITLDRHVCGIAEGLHGKINSIDVRNAQYRIFLKKKQSCFAVCYEDVKKHQANVVY